MIHLKNVWRSFGAKVAVSDLTLNIKPGELFALLGRNGAGKTTTIKMLVGLLQPEQGSIRIGDFDVLTQTEDSNRLIGYVPDTPYLYEKLTGREFLQFICEMYGMTSNASKESIQRHIEIFQLEKFIDNLAESYSHGMKQRTVFAAALVHSPPILIVDEPMVGLDPHSNRIVKNHLNQLVQDGTALLVSTHTLSLAEDIATRIGVMNGGKLLFQGTLAEMREMIPNPPEALEDLYLEMVRIADDHDSIKP